MFCNPLNIFNDYILLDDNTRCKHSDIYVMWDWYSWWKNADTLNSFVNTIKTYHSNMCFVFHASVLNPIIVY